MSPEAARCQIDLYKQLDMAWRDCRSPACLEKRRREGTPDAQRHACVLITC